MSYKLSSQKIDEMWKAYQEKQNLQYVAKKCQVNRITVRRYKDKNKWDERIVKINNQVAQKVDEGIAGFKVKALKINQVVINKFLKQLGVRKDPQGGFTVDAKGKDVSVKDYDTIIRQSLLLLGEEDGRIGVNFTDDERKERLKNVLKELARREINR